MLSSSEVISYGTKCWRCFERGHGRFTNFRLKRVLFSLGNKKYKEPNVSQLPNTMTDTNWLSQRCRFSKAKQLRLHEHEKKIFLFPSWHIFDHMSSLTVQKGCATVGENISPLKAKSTLWYFSTKSLWLYNIIFNTNTQAKIQYDLRKNKTRRDGSVCHLKGDANTHPPPYITAH